MKREDIRDDEMQNKMSKHGWQGTRREVLDGSAKTLAVYIAPANPVTSFSRTCNGSVLLSGNAGEYY